MEEQEQQPLEVLAPSAIMAMEKAQIDMQIATAHQYPRSLEQFKKRALAMATLDPETADSCIYVRPVGKEKDEKTGKWVQKFAEGPSIRLAEIVAVSYGNLRAASKVVEQTERYVKCTGMAHDLESNTAMSADIIESTVTRDGIPYSERQRALIAKVCGAKAIRDAILKIVPRALCKPIMEAAKKVAAGQDKPLVERRKKAQAWISTLKIPEARVFAALGVSGWDDVTNDILITLTGLKTAMADGDETIDGAFPPVDHAATGPKFTGPPPADAPNVQKPDNKPAAKGPKMPQDASEAGKVAEGVKQPPTSKTPQAAQTAAESAPSGESVPSDEAEEAKAGLAPASLAEPEREPFRPNASESEALQSVRLLMHRGAPGSTKGLTEKQVLAWAVKMKLAKPEQKLADLAEGKLLNISKNWHSVAGKIAAEPGE